MTHSLEDLIESSGQNAESKGFHDDGNVMRWLRNELADGKEVKLLVDGKEWDFSDGFWDRQYAAYKGNRQFLIVSEVVEALDEVRNGKPSIYEVDGKPEGVAVELGDAVIRIADYAWEFDEPVIEAIDTKAAYNATRERMHGGKLS